MDSTVHRKCKDQIRSVPFNILIIITKAVFFISVSYQLDAQNFCFTIGLFRASTCFEHMCSSSGQNCITQPLVSSHLGVMMPEAV